MIEIKDLCYSYPDGKQALLGIDLTVMPGQKVALIGANGAGKSTLLLHLNGILSGQGDIRINGLDICKKNLGQIRSLVGMVFQDPDDQLFSNTVFEDVAFGPTYQGFTKAEIEEKVTRALQAVQMDGFAPRNPYHLSEGEKKRVAIATVLSMQPQVLVLDEPNAGLDPRARRELIELLEGLPQTMLIATHDLDLAARLSTRTVLMSAGRIARDGPTGEILADDRLLEASGMK
jgi:cobalt transport protein ATP-binding subunit